MKAEQFNVTEEAVAKKLGLNRDFIRKLRADNLRPGEDFAQVGRDIRYAENGIEKMRLLLNKSAPPGVPLGDVVLLNTRPGPAAGDKPTVILDAVVTKIYRHNPQYLEALLGGQTVTIKVNHNANFIAQSEGNPGTVIPSRLLVMKSPRQFNFVGRCPRARGKW
jgi:hypothetical protein